MPPSDPTSLVRLRRRPGDLLVMQPLEAVRAQAAAYAQRSCADNTLRGYASQWRMFDEWCRARDLASLPCSPETLQLYLSERAQAVRVSTLEHARAAVAYVHRQAGYDKAQLPHRHPIVNDTLEGISRERGVAPRRVSPLLIDDLRAVVRALPSTPAGKRDRALLVLGFVGALRRSELAALRVSDVAFTPDGLRVTIRRSKTDQHGEGAPVALPSSRFPASCPVRTLKAWLDAAGIRDGRVFRSLSNGRTGESLSDRAIADIVKQAAAAAGLEGDYSGHSLRAGLATSAARAGKQDHQILKQGRWKTHTMLATYVRDANLFGPHNAADGL